MKMLFTDPSVVPCDLLKGMLAGQGITAMIKNERGAASAGVGEPVPFMVTPAFAWPEVWVADEDYEEAAALMRALKEDSVSGSQPWKCPACGEEVDAELSACWNCNQAKEP